MKKTRLLDQATTIDGKPMTLHEHDGAFMIRVDGVELMSSRQHHSEERLAELACSRIRAPGARVLLLFSDLIDASHFELLQAGGLRETILRSENPQIRATGSSLMPEGLEQGLSPQELADLIGYIKSGG